MVPLASRVCDDPSDVEAVRQRIQEAVNVAQWDEKELYRRVAQRATKKLSSIDAWVIDDTGFPKKGKHSVGVQRQYSGTLGRIDNCQIATSLHLASQDAGICIGMRLYLPESWCKDRARRRKVGVPDDVVFRKKWELALDQIDTALGWSLAAKPILGDAAFGDCGEFRRSLKERQLQYVLAVSECTSVWPPNTRLEPPPPHNGRSGRPRTNWNAPDGETPLSVATLAAQLKSRTIDWTTSKRGRFAACRIRTAHRHRNGVPPGDDQWLVIEYRNGAPAKFWFSNLPANTALKHLVYLAKLRWRIERDYQEMKGQLGLDHYEGRRWNGFHHHCACVAAAHAFLALHRALSPPG